MKTSFVLFSAGIIACAIAQETPPPAVNPGAAPSAPQQTPGLHGRLEINVNGEKRVIELGAPGKQVVVTEVDGKRETHVVDAREAEALMRSLLPGEKLPVRKGPMTYLGVATAAVPREVAAQLAELPQDTGLLVAAVAPDSPAAKAGIVESDVITKLDDQIIVTTRQLAVLIANRKKDEAVKISYYRKGQKGEATAVLGEREVPPQPDPIARITRLPLRFGPDGKPLDLSQELNGLPEDIRQQVEEAMERMNKAAAPPASPAPAQQAENKPAQP